jgi:hypothetical protein
MLTFGNRSLAIATVALIGSVASAQITLNDGGAVVDINTTNGTVENFFLGGVDHAFQHTYFLRNGDGGTASGLGTFALTSQSNTSNFAELKYNNGTFEIQIRYLLTGAGLQADLTESVVVRNISGQSASMRLFQYSDWDMAGTAGSDTVTRQNSSTMSQVDNVVTSNTLVSGGTPIPEFSGMSAFATIRTGILSTNGYFLDTAAGGGIGQQFVGDGTYAFQWNRDLAADGVFAMSTDKILAVPEPGSMIALGLGAAALLARRRRKQSA